MIHPWKILIAAIMALSTPVMGQSVQQSGTITPGHLPYWVTNGVIGDGGTSADSPVTSIGVTNTGQGICTNSARVTSGAWISMCLGFVSGVPTVTVQNNGSASPQPLQFIVNGTTFPFPGVLTSLAIGVTAVTGGTSKGILFNNGGFMGNLAPLANGVLVTDSNSNPSISVTLPSGLTIPSPTFTGTNFLSLSGIQQLNAATLIGNSTGGLGNAQQITLDPTLNFSGTNLKCSTGTASQNGCLHPDGVTMTVNGTGALTAVGASTNSIDAGGATTVTNGKSRDYLFQNGANVGHSGLPYGPFASAAGAL